MAILYEPTPNGNLIALITGVNLQINRSIIRQNCCLYEVGYQAFLHEQNVIDFLENMRRNGAIFILKFEIKMGL